ncbi:MAG: hypothetical protein M0Q21_09335 [Ignavibacteriaceae bacterium]|nr:hypothetical protein [Ignavibacteriaceae bacterium]
MKIPVDVEISDGKIKNYLLLKKDVGDKSFFLLQAGYSLENFEKLISDLREQILSFDAVFIEESVYGDKYKIPGVLIGPNGKSLLINTIWMKENITYKWKFITLFPSKEKTK